MADCFTLCTDLASSVKDLGYIGDISFHKGAPHPSQLLMAEKWTKPYSREYTAYPDPWLCAAKFWSTTYNVYGDRNLICTLQPPQEYEEKAEATT